MPRSKKILTKSTDGALPRHTRRFRQIRLEVAVEAARIIATEGQHNYRAAKKKAAARLGTSERLALPSNTEVKDALRRHQDLYGGAAHAENLERLRGIAVDAMYYFQSYNPRLVGSVLDGTAGEHSRIALHIFSDSIESVILHFLNKGVPFSQEQRKIRWFDGDHRTLPLLVFELDDATVELMIFDRVHLRQAPPSPIDGKPQQRATLAEIECLIAETSVPALLNGTDNPSL
jgi:hypothetical protein